MLAIQGHDAARTAERLHELECIAIVSSGWILAALTMQRLLARPDNSE